MSKAWFIVAAALAGCAPTQPLVDMSDVDPVAYQRVLDHCEVVAGPSDAAGPLVAGVLIGGSMGLGLGALISGIPLESAAGYGAASGAVAGGVLASTTNIGATISPGPPQSLDECLAAHGYKIVGHI